MYYLILIFAISMLLHAEVDARKIIIHELASCPEYPDVPFKVTYDIRDGPDDTQLISGDVDIPVPAGANLRVLVDVSLLVFGKWQKIISLNERDPCVMLKKYLGKPWVQVQRQSNIEPGVCPIPKGKYHLANFTFDVNTVSIKLPSGRVKGTGKVLQEEEIMYCMNFDAELK